MVGDGSGKIFVITIPWARYPPVTMMHAKIVTLALLLPHFTHTYNS